jgi:glycosyltransferase involved in cell wall biosynthesis
MTAKEDVGVQAPEQRQQVVAVIPAHNEERFIGSVVLRARTHADLVMVVDDGSTDATAEIAEAAGAVVIRHERNQGKGTALNTGFQKARDFCACCVVLLDADGQHFPEEIPVLLAPILSGEADLVIGSRYLNGRDRRVPGHRVWGHRVFNMLTRAASGVGATDSQSGFRAMSQRALRELSFSSAGFSVESEMQFLARERGLRVVEAPITPDYAEKPKRPVVQHGLMVLNGVLRLIGQYRPLLFFGLPGLIVLVIGLGWGVYVVELYRLRGGLAVGYAMISVLLTILGSLGLFAGIILHSIRGLLLELVGSRKKLRQDD